MKTISFCFDSICSWLTLSLVYWIQNTEKLSVRLNETSFDHGHALTLLINTDDPVQVWWNDLSNHNPCGNISSNSSYPVQYVDHFTWHHTSPYTYMSNFDVCLCVGRGGGGRIGCSYSIPYSLFCYLSFYLPSATFHFNKPIKSCTLFLSFV